MKNIHSSIFIIVIFFTFFLLITRVFFNSLHSVAIEFSQNMDANVDLNPRVGMEFDTLEDA